MPNKTVLVIDDNQSNIKLIGTVLQKCGCDVIKATSGLEGLLLAKSRRPDLILCDIQMPGIAGNQVMEKLRDSWATKNIPLMVITASAEYNDVMRAKEKGAHDYILKPIAPGILAERVAKILGNSLSDTELGAASGYGADLRIINGHPTKSLRIKELTPGLVVGDRVRGPGNTLLAIEGTKLTPNIIAKLEEASIEQVIVRV